MSSNAPKQPKFKDLVIQAVRLIPSGKVASYGQIASMVGSPRAALQVGYILHDSGDDGITPWWRVINSKGYISTKCEEHTKMLQRELLESEGIEVNEDLRIDMDIYRFIPRSLGK